MTDLDNKPDTSIFTSDSEWDTVEFDFNPIGYLGGLYFSFPGVPTQNTIKGVALL